MNARTKTAMACMLLAMSACTNRVVLVGQASDAAMVDGGLVDAPMADAQRADAQPDAQNVDAGPPPYTGFETHVLDGDEVSGGPSIAIAVDALGRDHIVWRDPDEGALTYALRDGDDIAIERIDPLATRANVDIVLDSRGQPHVSYASVLEGGSDETSTATAATRIGGFWNIERVDVSTTPVRHTAIAITSTDATVLAYAAEDGQARLATDTCGAFQSALLHEEGVDDALDIVTDSQDRVHAIYTAFDNVTRALTYRRSSFGCSSEGLVVSRGAASVDSSFSPSHVAIAMDRNDTPYICADATGSLHAVLYCGSRDGLTWNLASKGTWTNDIKSGTLHIARDDLGRIWASFYLTPLLELQYLEATSTSLTSSTRVAVSSFDTTSFAFEPGGVPHFVGSSVGGHVLAYRGTPD